MGNNYRWLLIGLVIFTLSACQTRIAPPSNGGSQEWLKDASVFENQPPPLDWQLNAKVGVVIDGKSEQANLNWESSSDSSGETYNRVKLFGPFGAGAIRLEYGSDLATLTDNKGRRYQGREPEKLIQDIVGWPLPIDALSYWLFAQPEPASGYRYQLSDDGRLSTLEQRGWRIEFKDWREFDGQELPRKVFAYKTFAQDRRGDVSVKLITKSWRWP